MVLPTIGNIQKGRIIFGEKRSPELKKAIHDKMVKELAELAVKNARRAAEESKKDVPAEVTPE